MHCHFLQGFAPGVPVLWLLLVFLAFGFSFFRLCLPGYLHCEFIHVLYGSLHYSFLDSVSGKCADTQKGREATGFRSNSHLPALFFFDSLKDFACSLSCGGSVVGSLPVCFLLSVCLFSVLPVCLCCLFWAGWGFLSGFCLSACKLFHCSEFSSPLRWTFIVNLRPVVWTLFRVFPRARVAGCLSGLWAAVVGHSLKGLNLQTLLAVCQTYSETDSGALRQETKKKIK